MALRGAVHTPSNKLAVAALFAIAATLGGLLTGALVAVLDGFVSVIPSAVGHAIILVVGTTLVIYDLSVAKIRLPMSARQIPDAMFRGSSHEAALRFGVEYGTGLRTFVTSTAAYILPLVLLFLDLHVGLILAAGAAFGFGRSIAIIQAVMSSDPAWTIRLSGYTRRFERLAAVMVQFAAVTLVFGVSSVSLG